MSNPIVKEVEQRFLSAFSAFAERLRHEFPALHITTWSSPVGSATSYQGHNLGIECTFPHAPSNHADSVALAIGVMQLTTEPKLCDASVCWATGGGPGGLEADLIDSPIRYSAAALDQLEAGLPVLYKALISALRNPPFADEIA